MSNNDCVSFTWPINNFSYCWQKSDEALISPEFSVYMPEETKWKLLFFPRGNSDSTCIAFYLYRDKNCRGGEKIEVEYSLEILAADGSTLTIASEKKEFRKDTRSGFSRYRYRDYITTDAVRFLPQDILTVRCRMTGFEGKTVKIRQIYARSIINVEKRVFQWPIEKFSTIILDQNQSFVFKSPSKEDMIKINLLVTSQQYSEKKVCLNVCTFDECMKFLTMKVFIIDSQKRKIEAGVYEGWFNRGICTTFPLVLSMKKIIENRSSYLPNDVLTLSFDLSISTGCAFEGVEKIVCLYTSNLAPNVVIENWRKCFVQERISHSPCALITDLTSLHEDHSACDMKLQTKTNAFPVHTLILSARSPVFKAMFSSEMKEKLNGCVDLSDLDDETVRQFLIYLYTDQLENLKWEDAMNLYRTADKYAVISLREKCSALLKTNLNLANACEALVLSDLHQDKELKLTVQNLILRNAKRVFKSEEWKLLSETNHKVVIETMLRNWTEE